jgi:hypothetical protein
MKKTLVPRMTREAPLLAKAPSPRLVHLWMKKFRMILNSKVRID